MRLQTLGRRLDAIEQVISLDTNCPSCQGTGRHGPMVCRLSEDEPIPPLMPCPSCGRKAPRQLVVTGVSPEECAAMFQQAPKQLIHRVKGVV